MATKVIFLILLIIGLLEIFLNVFTRFINNTIYKNKSIEMSEKTKSGIKLFFVIIFFISVGYFLFIFVQVMANLFGISLDQRFIDIFK